MKRMCVIVMSGEKHIEHRQQSCGKQAKNDNDDNVCMFVCMCEDEVRVLHAREVRCVR